MDDDLLTHLDDAARSIHSTLVRYEIDVAALLGIPYQPDSTTRNRIWKAIAAWADLGEELPDAVIEVRRNLPQAQQLRCEVLNLANAGVSLTDQDRINLEIRVIMLQASAEAIDRRVPRT